MVENDSITPWDMLVPSGVAVRGQEARSQKNGSPHSPCQS